MIHGNTFDRGDLFMLAVFVLAVAVVIVGLLTSNEPVACGYALPLPADVQACAATRTAVVEMKVGSK